MYSRRLESALLREVGRRYQLVVSGRPFIVEGVVIGLISAGISILVLKLVYESIMSAVKQLIPLRYPYPLTGPVVLWIHRRFGIAFGALGNHFHQQVFKERRRRDPGW